jgi:L-cystine transport system permease protein
MILGIDFIYVFEMLIKLIKVVPYTVLIITISGISGLFLAVIVTFFRLKKIKILSITAGLYVSFFRSTPALIHLFLVYYGFPILLNKIGLDISFWNKSVFAILSLTLFNGAYLSEILRPAYLAVDQGQHDAADSIGMTKITKLHRIIIPQALPIALPGLGNALIDLIKDTSVLFVIGLIDIMGKAKLLIANDYGVKKLEVYIAAGIIYWFITNISNLIINSLEKKYNSADNHDKKGKWHV